MRTIFLILSLFLFAEIHSQDVGNESFLKYHWFQKGLNGHEPVLKEIKGKEVFFFITKNESGLIEICNEDNYDIWIDNQLIFADVEPSCVNIETFELLQLSISDTIYFRISSDNLSRLSTTFISKNKSQQEILLTRNERSWLQDFIMLYGSIILIMAAFYRQFFNVKFRRALRNPFNFKIRGAVAQDSYNKFISADNIYALSFLCLCLAGLLQIINAELGLFNTQHEDLVSAISFWVLLSLGFFVFCLVKYILAFVLSQIFNLQNFPNIQLQDFIHFMTFDSGITLMLVFIDFTFDAFYQHVLIDIAKIVVIVAILFFQVWFYLKFVKYYSHRKLLIISYLCVTEFLPGFMAAYWLLN
jgi:hypothetical protein